MYLYFYFYFHLYIWIVIEMAMNEMTWQNDDADKCGGKFKKFYEDFHRAKSLIAFPPRRRLLMFIFFSPLLLLLLLLLILQNSNKTSVSQVMFKGFTEMGGEIEMLSCFSLSYLDILNPDIVISRFPDTEMSPCLSLFLWISWYCDIQIYRYRNVIMFIFISLNILILWYIQISRHRNFFMFNINLSGYPDILISRLP